MFCIIVLYPLGVNAVQIGNRWTGPWVDNIVFEVIQDDTQQVLDLIDGDVDIIGGQLDPAFLDQLYDAEDVEIIDILRFGYGIIEINCEKYPMNITNFRRALAFALDKHRIIEDGWLGLAELLDCHIPRQHPASIEDEMDYHYYDENIMEGARLLELEGFIDSDGDGWLEGPGPDGPGSVELETIFVEGHPTTQIDIFVDAVVQALLNLKISAEARQVSFTPYSRYVGAPDIIFHGHNWDSFDLDFYARDHSSTYIHTPLYNTPKWSNETWDELAEIVLSSSDYDEILNTVKQMEQIWVHSCPAIILYQNLYFTAYRSDSFQGIIPTIIDGAPSYYTNLRVHRSTGDPIGGTYTWANPLDILSFNHYSVNSAYAPNILNMLFDSLVKVGPDGNDILWMCNDFEVLTHADDTSVPAGHMRINIDVIQNATWSDGRQITAADFAFSLIFMRDHIPVAGVDLVDMLICYAVSPSKLVVEFNSESYWNWHYIAYKRVIPNKIWTNYSDAYDEYQPSPSSLEDMILSGPFLPKTWVQGDFVELVQNPSYFRNPRLLSALPLEENSTIMTSTLTLTGPSPLIQSLPISVQTISFIGGLYITLAIILSADYIHRRKHQELLN